MSLSRLKTIKKSIGRRIYGKEVSPWPDLSYPGVDLTYWRPKIGVNFGDELSRIIVNLILARRGMTFFDETSKQRDLLAIGSILHLANEGATVWGTGANVSGFSREYLFSHLDIRALRGPLTAEFLFREKGIKSPEVYGDPGLLLPFVTGERFQRSSKMEVGFVPNLNDDMAIIAEQLKQVDNVVLIDPKQSWNVCVRKILECNFIVSSSLHGLVIADAWNIPCRYVRISEHEGIFKYKDYYAGTGRSDFEYASNIREAIMMSGMGPHQCDLAALLESFPYDLWS